MKRLFTLLLAAALLCSVLSGCSGGTEGSSAGQTQSVETGSSVASGENQNTGDGAPDISEHITLKYYYLGDAPTGKAQTALDALNEKLGEKINVTLEAAAISWGDWTQKIPMVLASGENFDMIYTADWAFYFEQGAKGAFMNLDEMMPAYAPKVFSMIEERDMIDHLKVNGNLCMVPSFTKEVETADLVVREDLRKKYNCPEIHSYDDLEAFLTAVKENEPSMFPYAMSGTESAPLYSALQYETDWARPIVGGDMGIITYKMDEGKEVFSIADTPEYEAFVARQRDWFQKGFWSKSVLSEKTGSLDQFKAGTSAVARSNYPGIRNLYVQMQREQPDWEISFWSLEDNLIERKAPAGNGTAISINSKNPERSLMFLEYILTDEEAYHLMYNGVEGVNYALTEDGKLTRPEGVDPSENIGTINLGMGMNNIDLQYPNLEDWDVAHEKETELYDKSVIPALAGFTINNENISAEIAAIANVLATYKVPLDMGTVDPEEGLPLLRQKLNEAGIEKVIEELNGQISEYNASKKEA